MSEIKFLYFDLGRVLLDFTHERGFTQIARVANIDEGHVRRAMVDEGLSDRYELGELSTPAFHQAFCDATNATLSCEDLAFAWGDIFELMPQTVRLAASLRAAGYPLGILSNTCEAHWLHAVKNFGVLTQLFEPTVTSYETKSMKPDPAIYKVAAVRAGLEPQELFFVDDRMENVEAARKLGWTAVQFTTPLQLANDFERLVLAFNR